MLDAEAVEYVALAAAATPGVLKKSSMWLTSFAIEVLARPSSRLLHRFASRSSVLLSASMFGPSGLLPNMASADFC
jgi:hypothetical protein